MKEYHVYGLGNALVDTEFKVSDELLKTLSIDKGVMTLVNAEQHHQLLKHLYQHCPEHKRASGGSAANTIIAVSYFGGKTFYSCRTANDEMGDFYLEDLQRAGVATAKLVTRPTGITGKCLVMVTPDAERTMHTFLGITETFTKEDIVEEALIAAEYLYIEGYMVTSSSNRAATIHARELAQRHGVKIALTFSDPNMVNFFKEGLNAMLGAKVDLLFCNEKEALSWANTEDLTTAVAALKKIATSFAITLGSKGALVYDGENLIPIASHPVRAIDTNGAGDMFAGAFLYAITHGHSYKAAGQLASLAAATVVMQFGPRLPAEAHRSILNQILK